ncbi:hypothetical protein J1N35_004970 [Gossypium stocksii]|uniref:Uncharacterized protein n=1 Tax=Gossypium stocksii TaxID=47602 RepID=A0A9D3WEF6_9ROSI|nr:hypothetical protein J1N35_004970 [Gossypium stocksii]
MTSPCGKKIAIPASKKRKGPGSTSSSATTEVRHPFLQFLQGSQEKLFQILRARPLGVGRCIDWAALEKEDPEDITDDVPPSHEEPPSQPPPIHCPVYAAASYADISERLTRFE